MNTLLKTKYELVQFREIDSTNSYCLNHINELNDKTIVLSDKQKNGRGRLNRQWISNSKDNIYTSIVLKPQGSADNLPLTNITQYMSVKLCELLKEYNINANIKWPNDILVNGKKIAGILCEASFTESNLNGVVLGFGINTNFDPSKNENIDKPVTSIYNETGFVIDKLDFLKKLLDLFFFDYELFIKQKFKFIKNKYIKFFPYIDEEASINDSDSITIGKIKNISDDGALILQMSNGEEKIIILGDLTCSVKV